VLFSEGIVSEAVSTILIYLALGLGA